MEGYIELARNYSITYCHYICNIYFPNKQEITLYTDIGCDWVSYSLGRNTEYICSSNERFGYAKSNLLKSLIRRFEKLTTDYDLKW